MNEKTIKKNKKMTTTKQTKPKLKLLTLLFLFTSALTFTLLSCSSPTDPKLISSVTLTVDGVTSTEAFIKLSTTNVSLPASVTLNRNNKQINSFTLITADTTIVDKGLNPNQSYIYTTELTDANNQKVVSQKVVTQTMDTTDHKFTFETFTFGGQGGSSTLYDVAIINENDIWAVGEMYVYDSTGTPTLYNAVHWDGSSWELKRIKTEFRGNIITIELEGIFAFSPTDIWMVGSLPIHGDGQNWTMFDIRTTTDPNLSLSKAWGANTNDMYFVGRGGSIAHYTNGPSGAGWQKINSGTELNINDIWGDFNKETGKYEILAVASISSSFDRAILSIDPATRIVTQLYTEPIQYKLKGVWFKSNKQYYVAGDGIYQKNKLSDNSWRNKPFDITKFFIEKIRGNNINDIFAVGGVGEILHYNGISWKSYFNTTKLSNGNYYSIAVKDNLVLAVGEDNPKAVLIIWKH